ncbi:MAG: HAD family phosphatase [Planctomycetales bacterium]|nr:HAD family phosphatase [Planctomycetales bacterium]
MTEFIYFDLGKVLLDFDHGKACKQVADLAGITEAAVRQLVFEDDGLLLQFETGMIDERQFHAAFCRATGTDTDLSMFLNAYSDIFEVIPAMAELVRTLHSASVPLGILSNTSAAHWNLVCDGRFPFLPGLFREHVLSYEAQAMKPDVSIYELAVRRSGCCAASIFFCDDKEENISGAIAAGLDAVLFESYDQIRDELQWRLERVSELRGP